jgi:hypothetical protein
VQFTAAEQEEIDKFLAEYGTDVKAMDETGNTLLHKAVNRNVAVAKYLVSKGADVNAVNKGGQTPLHIAVLRSFDKDTDQTALAVFAQFLVSQGVDVNAKDSRGNTALNMGDEYYNTIRGATGVALAESELIKYLAHLAGRAPSAPESPQVRARKTLEQLKNAVDANVDFNNALKKYNEKDMQAAIMKFWVRTSVSDCSPEFQALHERHYKIMNETQAAVAVHAKNLNSQTEIMRNMAREKILEKTQAYAKSVDRYSAGVELEKMQLQK